MLILTKFTNAFEGVISMWILEKTIDETGWNIMNKYMGCMVKSMASFKAKKSIHKRLFLVLILFYHHGSNKLYSQLSSAIKGLTNLLVHVSIPSCPTNMMSWCHNDENGRNLVLKASNDPWNQKTVQQLN